MFVAKVLTLLLVIAGSKAQNVSSSTTTAEQVTPISKETKNQSQSPTANYVTVPSSSNASMSNASNIVFTELFKKVMGNIQEPPGMILFGTGFSMGIFVTAVIFCIIQACQRGKKKRSSYRLRDVEMTTQTSPEMDEDAIQDQEAASGEMGSAGQSLLDGGVAPKEAEYSDLDFSATKNGKAPEVRTIPETEYAEIKIENQAEIAEEDGGILEDNHETLKEDDGVNEEEMFCVPPEEAVTEDEFSRQITDES